jgi:sugar phosphate permease
MMKHRDRSFLETSNWIKSLPFYYGWVIVAVAGLAHFTSAPGQTYVTSVFLEPMIEDLNWSRTLFSGMYTAGSLIAALFMVVVGKALDRFGSRKMLATLCVLMGFSCIWMSGVSTEWQLLLGFAALRTIGQGSFGLVSSTMISIWFIRIRGRATAVASFGGAASMAIFPVIVHFFVALYDWRVTWLILGVSAWCILLIPSVLLVRRSPESVGLIPDGEIVDREGNNCTTEKNYVADDEFSYTLSHALRTRALWMLTLSSLAVPLVMTGLMFHHVSILGAQGISSQMAAVTLGLFGPLMLVFSVVSGLLADRFPGRYLLALGQAILVVAMLWVFVIGSSWQAIIYVVISAAAVGLVHTTGTVIWANYFGRAYLGSIRGFATTVMVAFSAMGALPFGFIYDWTGTYDMALWVLMGLPLTALIFSLFASPPRRDDNVSNTDI